MPAHPLKVFDRHILGLMFYVEYRWQVTISEMHFVKKIISLLTGYIDLLLQK